MLQERKPSTVKEIREACVAAGGLRASPSLRTTATTILAYCHLTSTSRGSRHATLMAIPSLEACCFQTITMFTSCLYALWHEWRLRLGMISRKKRIIMRSILRYIINACRSGFGIPFRAGQGLDLCLMCCLACCIDYHFPANPLRS